MNCQFCRNLFTPKYKGDTLCSINCLNEYKNSLKHPINKRISTEARDAAENNWNKVMHDVSNCIIDREKIIYAISWLNDLDREEVKKRDKEYMHMLKREEWLIDPDMSSGNNEMDEIYAQLRQKYQEIYGKDIKHG